MEIKLFNKRESAQVVTHLTWHAWHAKVIQPCGVGIKDPLKREGLDFTRSGISDSNREGKTSMHLNSLNFCEVGDCSELFGLSNDHVCITYVLPWVLY